MLLRAGQGNHSTGPAIFARLECHSRSRWHASDNNMPAVAVPPGRPGETTGNDVNV